MPDSPIPSKLSVTFVIAAWNEAENLEHLIDELQKHFYLFQQTPEVIIVDDGSSDATTAVLAQLKETRPWLLSLHLPHQGKSGAWQAGFAAASREWICTLDADLQNDPAYLPSFIRQAETGFDFISGARKRRQNNLFTHLIPSWLGNKLLRMWTGLPLTDHGCGMKFFKKALVEGLILPEGMHRLLGALVHSRGARVNEVVIYERHRHTGVSKYSWKRWYVFLITLIKLNNQLQKQRDQWSRV